MLEARWAHCSEVVGGKIYAIGGSTSTGPGQYHELTSVEEYNPITDTWITKTPMPGARGGISSGMVEGKIYVIGSAIHKTTLQILSTVEEYDPASDLTNVNKKNGMNELPINYSLSQNYPNPFNPSTTIKFSLPQPGFITLKVFNMLGEEVAALVNDWKEAGTHSITFDIRNSTSGTLSSGVYFYRLSVGAFGQSSKYIETKKLMLIK